MASVKASHFQNWPFRRSQIESTTGTLLKKGEQVKNYTRYILPSDKNSLNHWLHLITMWPSFKLFNLPEPQVLHFWHQDNNYLPHTEALNMKWDNAGYGPGRKAAAINIALVTFVILIGIIGAISHLHQGISPGMWVNFEDPVTEKKVAWGGWIRQKEAGKLHRYLHQATVAKWIVFLQLKDILSKEPLLVMGNQPALCFLNPNILAFFFFSFSIHC